MCTISLLPYPMLLNSASALHPIGHMYDDPLQGVSGQAGEYPLEYAAWWATPMATGARRHLLVYSSSSTPIDDKDKDEDEEGAVTATIQRAGRPPR